MAHIFISNPIHLLSNRILVLLIFKSYKILSYDTYITLILFLSLQIQFSIRNSSSISHFLVNKYSRNYCPLQTREAPSRIFLINCLCAIRQPLLGHDVASEYVKKLGSMIENHIHGLVDKEVDSILQKCGLSNKMSHFHESLNDIADESVSRPPLADMEDMAPAALSECLKAFFGLILGSETSLPEFDQMQVPSLRSEACSQLSRSLAEAYEVIYKGIMDPKNGYPDPRSLARHPPDQIRTILGI